MQKENLFFFSFPSASKFGEAKVTKSREQNKTNSFVFSSETENSALVTLSLAKNFAVNPQSYEKTSEMQKENLFFFSFPSASKFGEARVTKKRVKCKRKTCFSSHFRVPVSSAKPELRKKETIEARQQFFVGTALN